MYKCHVLPSTASSLHPGIVSLYCQYDKRPPSRHWSHIASSSPTMTTPLSTGESTINGTHKQAVVAVLYDLADPSDSNFSH